MLKVYSCFVGIVLTWVSAVIVDHRHGSLGESAIVDNAFLPQDEWFLQRLDHFDPTNHATWLQRYLKNATWFKNSRDSPVFLLISGEQKMTASWMKNGAWLDYAEKYNALCFQLEHRFYGKSKPTEDSSVSNLRYLNSEQALADLAYFIDGMNEKYNLTIDNKWIVFGGSYPGSLAAWARLKYPHLIHGAVSSSGPLLAKADFNEYNEVARKSLAAASKQCASNVHQAALMIEQLLKKGDEADVRKLSKMFQLRHPLDIRNPEDVFTFVWTLALNINNAVQYNNQGNYSIEEICMIMNNKSIGTPVDRYAEVNTLVMASENIPYMNATYREFNQSLLNDTRTYIYQLCVEFGFYQTSSSKLELFGSLLRLPNFIDWCKTMYGEGFDSNLLNEGIKRTNLLYGQVNIQVSRVVFVHGSLDPWHVLGIYNSTNPEAPAILIDGASHCADMLPASPKDSPQLTKARKKISGYLGEWLST